MKTHIIPPGYRPLLSVRETEYAIKQIKDFFQTHLASALRLTRVTAPLLVAGGTGINDDLNGVEAPVRFPVRAMDGGTAEIVQSLAKWKRMALADLSIPPGRGIYTDMNAIRPDERLDNLHSLYVDQWDWERVITPEERNLDFLRAVVRRIYDVLKQTEDFVSGLYPEITPVLPEEIHFVHSEELEKQYPGLSPREREERVCREYGAVFVIGIGAPLCNGQPHDGRAPDYDDWSSVTPGGRGLNGDIVCWYPLLQRAFELSSMGIRVDAAALAFQLRATGAEDRRGLLFHRRLLGGELPLSIGGGIGQSRLCMFYLRKAHIGEVQAGLWPADMIRACRENHVPLL